MKKPILDWNTVSRVCASLTSLRIRVWVVSEDNEVNEALSLPTPGINLSNIKKNTRASAQNEPNRKYYGEIYQFPQSFQRVRT